MKQHKKEKKLKRFFLGIIVFGIVILLGEKNATILGTRVDSNLAKQPIFTLYKEDGETFNPIEGTKFIITDLEGENVIGTDGKIVGELEKRNGVDSYVLTTDESGYLKANLPKGKYKAIEIEANEAYQLPENEADRTYYFEIGATEQEIPQWINGIRGYSWNEMKSVIANTEGGVTAVGSISEYLPEVTGDFYNGVDFNSDGIIDEVSEGQKDGIIISYDENGNYLWSETLGGIYDDVCNQIIQTTDGGYVIVGYTASPVVYLKGKAITDLSKSNYEVSGKDGFLLKLKSTGEYEWGVRIGGNLEDEIVKVIQTKEGDIAMIGNFDSKTLNFYEPNSNGNLIERIENKGEVNCFLASYSITGKYNWSQTIEGDTNAKIYDITEMENSIAVAVNYKGSIKIGDNYKLSSYLKDFSDGLIINYSLKGEVNWYYEIIAVETNMFTPEKYIQITSLATTKEDSLIIATACTGTIKAKKQNSTSYDTIYVSENSGICANLIVLSKEGEFVKNLYSLNSTITIAKASDATILFNDVVTTVNNEILLGGYYYSDKNIDVDKDGLATGNLDFIASSGFNPNGFWIKLDLNGKVKFSDCFYRKDNPAQAASSVNTVGEMSEERIVTGGNFFWNTATTKKFYTLFSEKENYDKYYLDRIGNREGVIILENTTKEKIEILEAKQIKVQNDKKKFTITTEVKSHTEKNEKGEEIQVKGGTISGDYNQTIDGIQYTEEGIHYMEIVAYGDTATKEIVMTPEKGYKIRQIMINNQPYADFNVDDNGNVVIPIFQEVKNNIHVTVEYAKIIVGLHELPMTGGKNMLWLDLLGGNFICLGIRIIKWKNRKKGKIIKDHK